MSIRKILAKIHLIIGLGTGILFSVVALSGALYTWEPEVSRIIYQHEVEKQSKPFVPVTALINTMKQAFPEGDFRTALYRDQESSIEVLLYVPGTYYLAQINPYTAELIHLQDMKQGWLNHLKNLHRNLLLGDIGREIVHWVTLLALPMLISGLVLWWPIRGWPKKEKFYIKWSVSPKKLNYDLHNILGFYATWILIFSVVTGLFWGFEIVKDISKEISGENEISYETPTSKISTTNQTSDSNEILNSLIKKYHSEFSNSQVRIGIPHRKDEAIHLSVIDPNKGINAVDHFYHDRYSGEPIQGEFLNGLSNERSTFNLINGMVYDIHLGGIMGLPGRILVFLASLIGASLPITGFIFWLSKNKNGQKTI
ncbi:PepSY-associated TM helix domain-containing protein [Cyclobacterium qasimii]|uniref:PepSY-associated TM helix domain protein n=2 Tax=Cyclobacterium qasimii TaxID=1350429 RepID=S7WUK8_9BACT|nr:PepSY-associated TM helix domain-containing protein [Cyclobacterium qasimii]EPR67743.1 PepSY-associated TM helix domain protein [Cyclobacterium qasimii M12-11B]GEO20343.1 membrane protein [Cyclobacterium qasimii]